MVAEMNLPELIERFGSEDKCHAYLEELRWRYSLVSSHPTAGLNVLRPDLL